MFSQDIPGVQHGCLAALIDRWRKPLRPLRGAQQHHCAQACLPAPISRESELVPEALPPFYGPALRPASHGIQPATQAWTISNGLGNPASLYPNELRLLFDTAFRGDFGVRKSILGFDHNFLRVRKQV